MRKAIFVAILLATLLFGAGIASGSPGLKVYTDKRIYNAGEEVQISMVNEWNDNIVTGYGFHVTTPSGEIVYDAFWIEIAILVPPGGSIEYTWDQTYQMSPLGDDGAQVASGHYVIHDNHGPGKAHIWLSEPGEIPFETVEQGSISYYGYGSLAESEYLVIRDDTAWSAFWAEHKSGMFPTPEKPYVDFNNEMVIVAIHGTYPTSGAGIAIESIDDYASSWQVNVVKSYTDGILPVVTNPYHIVKTPYSDLLVEFEETIVVF